MSRRLFCVAVLAGTVCGPVNVAFASWVQTGAGVGQAKAVAVGATSAPTAIVSGQTVALSWPATTYSDGSLLNGYQVSRYDAAGTVVQTIASGTCASVVATTSCSETSVPPGDWRYAVTPAAGNWRGATSPQVAVTVHEPDTTAPPTPTVSGQPSSPTASGSASFTVTDTEPSVAFRCTLDGVAAACGSPVSYAGLVTGSHSFSVVAVDAAGNASASTTPFSWTVDTTSPTGAVTFPASGSSQNQAGYLVGCPPANTGDICGTAADVGVGVATVRLSIQNAAGRYWNGANFVVGPEVLLTPTGTTSWLYTLAPAKLTDGVTYTLRLSVTDAVGNASSVTSTFTYDTTAPAKPTVSSGPSNPTAATNASFTLTDADSPVTYTCTLDGVSAACANPAVFSGLATGNHTFSARAVDPAGNTSAASANYNWTVDATPPSGVITFPVSGGAYNTAGYNQPCGTGGTGDLCGTASGGVSSVRVSVQNAGGLFWNGTDFVVGPEVMLTPTGTGNWKYALAAAALTDGSSYTVRLYVTDAVGNVSTPVSSTFRYDTTRPTGVGVAAVNGGGGVAGAAEAGDTVSYTFSETLAPASLLTGFTGAAVNVVVRITDGGAGPDVLTVWNSSNNNQVALGSVSLGQSGYVTANVTFGLTGTPSTMVQNGSTITVTLGTVSNAASVGTVVGAGSVAWTVAATDADLAGNLITGTPPATIAQAF